MIFVHHIHRDTDRPSHSGVVIRTWRPQTGRDHALFFGGCVVVGMLLTLLVLNW